MKRTKNVSKKKRIQNYLNIPTIRTCKIHYTADAVSKKATKKVQIKTVFKVKIIYSTPKTGAIVRENLLRALSSK